jgi:hypothetical protein
LLPPPAAQQQNTHQLHQQRGVPVRVFNSYGQVQVPCLKALLSKDKRRQEALAEYVAAGSFSAQGSSSRPHHQQQQQETGDAAVGEGMEVEEQQEPGLQAGMDGPYSEGDLDEALTPAATFIRGQVGAAAWVPVLIFRRTGLDG